MNALEPPEWLPEAVFISTYPIESLGEAESRSFLEKLRERYGGSYSEDLRSLHFITGSFFCCVKWLCYDSSQVFMLATGSKSEKEGLNSIPAYSEYDEQVYRLKELLPEKPNSIFHLKFAYCADKEKAIILLRRYLENQERDLQSAGFVKGLLIATLNVPEDTAIHSSSRNILILPHELKGTYNHIVWGLCFEISSLAACIGEVSKLYYDRRLMFDQMDASEGSTQLRINEILAEMRRPVDEIQPIDLENILKEITIQFSRLSTLASSIRRDRVKMQSVFRKIKNLYNGWKEKPLDEYLTNSSTEIAYFENLIAPFGDYVERTEALMSQLDTVQDSVRTYLGIKQQKMSIIEESSSKEQLIRLVNLQEILHKLEILIVAVYLTEMARFFFEAFVHEHVILLTAIFIPIALMISIFIGRLLHKKH